MIAFNEVEVLDKEANPCRLLSVEDAALFILTRWPRDRRGAAYDAACEALIAAFDGAGTSGAARAAFIEAAISAEILISEETWDAYPQTLGERLIR